VPPAFRKRFAVIAPSMDHLTHPCPTCGTVLQYRAESGSMLFKCPTCGGESLLPPPPREEDRIIQEQFDEAADRLRQQKRERKQWRRVRLGLGVICAGSWATTAVISIGLVGFIHTWLAQTWAWPGTGSGTTMLAIIGILLGTTDPISIVGYWFCRQGPKSPELQMWVRANMAISTLTDIACVGTGIAMLVFALSLESVGTRLAVAAVCVLFLAQCIYQALLLRAVAHAQCSPWLKRKLQDWLCCLAGVVVMAAVILPSWPGGGAAPWSAAEWFGAMLLSFMGLFATIVTWLCFAWRLRILHILRAIIQ
jgi:predicted RNA-binding Zn-ribbon protein involved in translation (DUF1610 family)